jgi:cytochrome c556
MKSRWAALVCASLNFHASATSMQTDPSLIENRQASLREIGTAFKAINDELKKDTPVKFILSSSAKRIASGLQEFMTMFPPGSGPESGVKTKARKEIWSNREEFEKLNAASANEAEKLSMLIRSPDLGAVREQAKVLGNSCKSCHQKFRVADD